MKETIRIFSGQSVNGLHTVYRYARSEGNTGRNGCPVWRFVDSEYWIENGTTNPRER